MRTLTILLALLQATFAVKTDLVLLPVTVIDRRGHAVGGLMRDDFRVFDEGRLRPIVTFGDLDTPVSVVLAVDYSLSMRPRIDALAAGIGVFAESARPEDELFVLRFNDEVSITAIDRQAFRGDVATFAAALVSEPPPAGRTALYDGIIEGLRRLEPSSREKRALVVISDGGDNASRHTLAEMVAKAKAANAVIYAIGLVDDETERRDRKVLEGVSRESGGTASFARSASEVRGLLEQVSRDLRQQYTIGITPDEAHARKREHRLRVTVSAGGRGGLTLRTRASYEIVSPPQ